MYVYIYIYLPKQNDEQCSLPFITTMALWQFMQWGTWCTVATLYTMFPSALIATKPLWWQPGEHIVHMIAQILRPSYFCEIWALYVSWIIYDHLYNIYIHREVWAGITWYRCETSHLIFPCLVLGVWSIPQSIERSGLARRKSECDPY